MKTNRLAFLLPGFLTALLVVFSAAAHARDAYVSTDLNLRAGPSTGYPAVVRLRSGTPVHVQGCLSDYRWCDVATGPYRGWVYAAYLAYPYRGRHVPIINYGSAIGLGIVGFSVGHYWDNHYRTHRWYSERDRWHRKYGHNYYERGGGYYRERHPRDRHHH